MQLPLEQFDISEYDSSAVNSEMPAFLLSKIADRLRTASCHIESEQVIETKMRAVLNTLVNEGLRQSGFLRDSTPAILPRLAEVVLQRKMGLDVAILQKKLVCFAPSIHSHNAVEKFARTLNYLIDQAYNTKTWILDLSAISMIPFELFGYLIGLKHNLSRLNIQLELLWLRQDAVPSELLQSIQENFNLSSKGTFLISK